MADQRNHTGASALEFQADFTTQTPGLSPSISARPSPAFATLIQTPDGSDVEDFDFSIGEPAQTAAPLKQVTTVGVPECWGHRGVSGL
jgi:hypothetical protein